MSNAPEPSDIEKRLTALEEGGKKKTRDFWDLLDVSGRFFSTIVLAVIALVVNSSIHNATQANQTNQLFAQIQSQREMADSQLRAQMFDSIIGKYFDGPIGKDPEMQLKLLTLLASNFHEFFDSKPLFEMFQAGSPEISAELKSFFLKIANRQELMVGAGRLGTTTLNLGEEKYVEIHGTNHNHWYRVTVTDIQPDGVRIRVNDPKQEHFDEISFGVSYLDLPLIDNTPLDFGHYLSVTLKDVSVENKTAELKVFEFTGEDRLVSRYRPALGQLSEQSKRQAKSK